MFAFILIPARLLCQRHWMPQTSRFISPPKARCDLRAGSAVIPGLAHERAAAAVALRGKVCPADVGRAAVHMCSP